MQGPIWYASGAVVQVLLFAVLAIELKKKAPSAHTFLEVVLARYGKGAHIVYLTFSMITNIVSVTMQILLDQISLFSALHHRLSLPCYCWVVALLSTTSLACTQLLYASYCLWVSLYILYSVVLRRHLCLITRELLPNYESSQTCLTQCLYSHTVVIFIIIISFVFTVYGSSPKIGSIGTMYDLLVAASERNPIVDNEQGSLVTMSSLQALIFGIINIVGNFGTVFVDNVSLHHDRKDARR